MIQANELRRNNLIMYGNMIYPVDRITENSISVRTGSQSLRTGRPHEFEPVPLDPGILEACGFEKRLGDANGQVWGILNFTLIYGRTDDGDFGWFLNGYHNDCHLQYLHQLQNLFFILRGTELTINLEKVKA